MGRSEERAETMLRPERRMGTIQMDGGDGEMVVRV